MTTKESTKEIQDLIELNEIIDMVTFEKKVSTPLIEGLQNILSTPIMYYMWVNGMNIWASMMKQSIDLLGWSGDTTKLIK